MDFYIFI